jgi:Uma2 family endonuclease
MGSISDGVTLKKRLFDVEEYHRLGETGILGEDDRVELIEGELLEMSPIGGVHVSLVSVLDRLINRQCDETQIVHVQNPLRLSQASEPQPGCFVASFRLRILVHPQD